MSLPLHIALVPYGINISASEITAVAATLSKQVERDFGPIWNIYATVNAFVRLEDIPIDYWPIIIASNVQGAEGYHEDSNGQPFSVVAYQQGWSITASHELLEMITDPFGRLTRAGNLLDQAILLGFAPQRVLYLVEVCDPCEGEPYSYEINGIKVSDFYTPGFFDPIKVPGVRYSFTGAIDAPRKVLDGGYISWLDLNLNNVFQLRMFPDAFSNKAHVLNLSTGITHGNLSKTTNLRSAIDGITHPHGFKKKKSKLPKSGAEHIFKNAFSQQQDARAHNLKNLVSDLVNSASGSKRP